MFDEASQRSNLTKVVWVVLLQIHHSMQLGQFRGVLHWTEICDGRKAWSNFDLMSLLNEEAL